MDDVRVYFAGPMFNDGRVAAVQNADFNPRDWTYDPTTGKQELVNHLLNHEEVRGGIIRTGPWSYSNDHGTAHYPTAHGLCDPEMDNMGNRQTLIAREDIVRCSLSGIDRADVVLATVTKESFGTICEVGYAIAKGKPVVFRDPTSIDPELWFGVVGSFDAVKAMDQKIWDAIQVDRDVYLMEIATSAPKYTCLAQE
jgi:hypothetical protein